MHISIRRSLTASCAGLAMAWTGAAHAVEEAAEGRRATDKSEANLACLKVQAPTVLSAPPPADGQPRLFRALLVFTAANEPPGIDWLWNGDDGAAALLTAQLRGSRMPCLKSPAQQAVLQEYWWTPGTGALEAGTARPLQLLGQAPIESFCYVKPTGGMAVNQPPEEATKVLFEFRFLKDGEPPEVEIVHRSGSASFAADARRYVRRYQPCAGGRTTRGAWHEQLFQVMPHGAKPLQPKVFDLQEYLGQVKGAKSLRARFDTHTMNCPFQVKLRMYQPARRNEALIVNTSDLDRHAFVSWLEHLQLDLTAAEEVALFHEIVTVNVPCQLVDLK